MVSGMHKIDKVNDLKNYNVVKLTVDNQNNALCFSRSIIPYNRDNWESLVNKVDIPKNLKFYKHLGLYG